MQSELNLDFPLSKVFQINVGGRMEEVENKEKFVFSLCPNHDNLFLIKVIKILGEGRK